MNFSLTLISIFHSAIWRMQVKEYGPIIYQIVIRPFIDSIKIEKNQDPGAYIKQSIEQRK